MDKKVENEMETGIVSGVIGGIVYTPSTPLGWFVGFKLLGSRA